MAARGIACCSTCGTSDRIVMQVPAFKLLCVRNGLPWLVQRGNARVQNWWSTLTMRASAAEYRSLPLRGHELLRDVPLYDVSFVDLPGGGSGRTVADIRALESETAPSQIATLLYGL